MILMLGIDVPSDSIKGPHRSRSIGQRGSPTLVSDVSRAHARTRDASSDGRKLRSELIPADGIGAATKK
jgi:hypothetical protein